MDEVKIKEIIERQRIFFNSGQTKDVNFRLQQLKKLQDVIRKNEKHILSALKQDLNRCEKDSYLSEIWQLNKSLQFMQKNLAKFVKPVKCKKTLPFWGSTAFYQYEPYGVVLIMAPWNYPFELTLNPLIGAIAAGNCAILKPSELAPYSSNLIYKIITEEFASEHIAVVQGDHDVAKMLLDQQFDYIFFTGSSKTGSLVMQAAAKNLTPVTLELGGKSPCIVDNTVDICNVAQKIVWGKFFNVGQTCIAPDYLVVDKRIKNELIEEVKKVLVKFYGENPLKNDCYGKVINENHFNRLVNLIEKQGFSAYQYFDRQTLKIAPIIIEKTSWKDPVMEEEIFGPILPIIEYEDLDLVIQKIRSLPKPLSIYVFSQNEETQNSIINQISSGSVCINDTLVHYSVQTLPFGGVGQSGMGKYHGKASFDTFSHQKGIFKSSNLCEFLLKIRYPSSKVPFWLLKRLF